MQGNFVSDVIHQMIETIFSQQLINFFNSYTYYTFYSNITIIVLINSVYKWICTDK